MGAGNRGLDSVGIAGGLGVTSLRGAGRSTRTQYAVWMIPWGLEIAHLPGKDHGWARGAKGLLGLVLGTGGTQPENEWPFVKP